MRLGMGNQRVCATDVNADLFCWGSVTGPLLADGTPSDSLIPVPVGPPVSPAGVFASGSGHTCAVVTSGRLFCWGSNRWEQLGASAAELHFAVTPRPVEGLSSVTDVGAGLDHTCAIESKTSHVYCWGSNGYGKLGVPTSALLRSHTPVQVMVPP
jgi:alpha-tubulin suppressor-like RCC1 family protein